jgi:hypothetical protein
MMRMAVQRVGNDMCVVHINAQRRSSAHPAYLNTVLSFNIFSSILTGVMSPTSILGHVKKDSLQSLGLLSHRTMRGSVIGVRPCCTSLRPMG